MEVRRMRAGEGQRLRELRLAALADAPDAFSATVARDAARPQSHWAAMAGGPGAVFVTDDFSAMAGVIPDGRVAELWGTWVAPAARGSGAGGALVETVAEWARVRGLAELRLSVSSAAPEAEALYARHGFARTGEARPLRGSVVQYTMVRPLAPEPYRLETERLLMRPFEMGDVAGLHAILSREDVVRFLYPDPASEGEVRERLARRIRRSRFTETGDGLGFATVRKDTGELIGDCSLTLVSAEHLQGEVGFVFHPDHHGRGYATEAGRALLELGFGTFGLHRLIGRLEARNAASARVLERLGMREEAHLVENELVKGEWQSERVYAILGARASRGA